jgi:hypothetical protein
MAAMAFVVMSLLVLLLLLALGFGILELQLLMMFLNKGSIDKVSHERRSATHLELPICVGFITTIDGTESR